MTSLFNTLKQLAITAGMGEDTKIQFSMKPNAGESGFRQWHGAMKMVARLPGGIPREFRKTLWLTLAERHISSKNINWSHVERTCFNDSTNPDDEELGVQIVKDLHRTGCSLFCGTSGEENQAVLKRVLLAYARWNKSVGYCQGFNMLAALILEVMDRCEYNSLKVMIYLIEGVLPESYFANSLRGFSIDMAVFRDLLRLKLPELSKHLEALQTGSNDTGNTYEPPLTNAFTMQWFLTLFCNCLPHSTVLRVWDLIFLEGNQVLLKTALAIWDTLSDRIMPVKSADEFYSIMCVLTREMLEFGLMDANCLIKTISSIELSELTELRERYIYNITPWTQVARNGLRLFYSDDEDDTDEEGNDEKASDGAYGFLKVATKHGSQSIRSISPSSILGPLANEKEKIALDILALKKQYCKIKERQRQAQIIFTAANNTQEIVGSMMSSASGPAINHLFLNKNAVSTPKVIKTQKPSIPVSRAVQRLKENAVSTEEPHNERGETVYWDKRMKKRKRRRTRINVSKTASLDSLPPEPDSSDLSDSSTTSSFKSSSSTELCDELAEIDSEDANTSMSEYGTSPHYRLRSSNLSLLDDDKSESEQNQAKSDSPSDVHEKSSEPNICNPPNSNEEHILNVLLTSSIMANEQLNKEKALNEPSVEDISSPNEFKAFSDHCDNDAPQLQLSGSELSPSFDSRINLIDVEPGQSSTEDLETALEHMKIDALEILLSSQTLESIRQDSETDFYQKTDCDRPSNEESSECFASGTNLGPFSINRETEIALERILSENTEVLKKVNQTYSSFESRCGDSISRQSSHDALFDSLTSNNVPLCSEPSERPGGNLLGETEEYTEFQAPESSGTSECDHDTLTYPPELSVFDNSADNELEPTNENTQSYIQTSSPDFAPSVIDTKNILDNELRSSIFSNKSRLKYHTDDENEEPKDNRRKKKYKSLDNLYILPKSKLKIGLVSRAGKWISISIDNSDLVVFNHLPDNLIEMKLSEGTKKADWRKSRVETKTDLNEFESSKKSSDAPDDPYLHLNFDIIAPGRKRRDPMEQYVHKKNMISQNYRAPELTAINFNPFPSKPNSRPPKELGVKLGLYSSSKK